MESSFGKLRETDSTLLALHVIGIAACIEVCVREAVKRLVDFGEPYLRRAELFKEHIRFDFSLTKALSTGQITFGDLISHSLPVSRLDHVASHFETLFNDDKTKRKFRHIISAVRRFAEPSDDELLGNEPPGSAQEKAPPLITDAEGLLNDIASIFEIRHLVAHEANFRAVSLSILACYLNSARTFVDALFELVEQTLNPGVARSGFGCSIQEITKANEVHQKAQDAQSRILEKILSIKSNGRQVSALFQEGVRIFDAYFEAEANLHIAIHGMTTGNALRNIEADVMKRLWQQRIEHLCEFEETVDFCAKIDQLKPDNS